MGLIHPLMCAGFLLLAATVWSRTEPHPQGPVGAPPLLPPTRPYPFTVVILAENLEVPWGIAELPDGRFLLTERPGRLRILDTTGLDPEPVQGVPAVFAHSQGGLLDVALHPHYQKNGWIYLAYSAVEKGRSHTRILRARLNGKKLTDSRVIFSPPPEQFTSAGHHFGCRLVFGPDGCLYFSIGDRGVMENAQNLSLAAGKIHRINDDGSVPEDNPFRNRPEALPTLYALGSRNAQGLRFHPFTGKLWATEHGPRGGDELNLILPGRNYGWPVISYGINYSGTRFTDQAEAPGMEQPVVQWTPSPAVTGLEILSGKGFPQWRGNFFVATLVAGSLFRLEVSPDGRVLGQENLLENVGRIRHVREASDGRLLLLLENPGRVIALQPR